jgi:hypothetical protein
MFYGSLFFMNRQFTPVVPLGALCLHPSDSRALALTLAGAPLLCVALSDSPILDANTGEVDC